MQNLDVAGAILAMAAVVIFLVVRRSDGRSRLGELAAGILVGGLAAVLVLVMVSDVVPDGVEAVARPVFFASMAILILGGLWTGLARR